MNRPDTEALKSLVDSMVEAKSDEEILFLQELVRTPSVNPFHAPDTPSDQPIEYDVAALIAETLDKMTIRVELIGKRKERPNVVGRMGQGRPILILNGHMDTVAPSPSYTRSPFGGETLGGRLFGIGSLDMKASLAAFVYAARAVKAAKAPLRGTLILTFVVDEESGAVSPLGTHHLLSRGLTGDAAIVAEPGTERIGIGHRGGYRFKVQTLGEAVHTGLLSWSRKERGRNAIVDMAHIVANLSKTDIPSETSPLFPGHENVLTFPTLINGGENVSSVPETCCAYGEVRFLPGTSLQRIKNKILEELEGVSRDKGIRYKLEDLVEVPATLIGQDEKIVRLLTQNATTVLGRQPKIEGVGPWNDSWMLIEKGIPTVTGFGCDGGGAHGPDEWVDLGSLIAVTKIFARVIVDFLG